MDRDGGECLPLPFMDVKVFLYLSIIKGTESIYSVFTLQSQYIVRFSFHFTEMFVSTV